MTIKITGVNIDIGESLRNYTEDLIEKKIQKYFDYISRIDIFYSKHKNNFHVKIAISELPLNKGLVVKSDGSSSDARSALEESIERSIKQLLRYKKKIADFRKKSKNYQHFKNPDLTGRELDKLFADNFKTSDVEVSKYILKPNPLAENKEDNNIAIDDKNIDDNINIVEEKNTIIEKLSVDDAIMKMDLADLPALVFINKDSERLNFVYYRKDGRLSLIDSQEYNEKK